MSKKGVLSKEERIAFSKELTPKEQIKTSSAISWDGRGLLIRIPKDIADYFGINKKNRKNKRIQFSVKEETNKIIKEFDIIENEKASK